MNRTLREAVERLWVSLWRWRDRALGEEEKADQTVADRGAARANFWTDFREGQREAEARARLRS